ncbi:aldo/keto reductase [Thermincola ferriacetica]|uniref:Aldo/keto reductase n=1 Tax=Thermincola ferriacetica TaxID=281456 RepID=A0A0L6W3U3_9FIRM|nr:aldo/keto reductase [Thermincola ferriacetica]KNZ70205.1 aldo/keto reductase [Thermincola ferriacetica]
MEYRELGKTGLQVSRLCFGALTIGPLQRNLPLREGAEVLRHAFRMGVNFIDTADLYGTYPYIREALRGMGREIIVASKSYDYTREGMRKSVEKARRELDRDVVDIFMLHEQESELTIRGHWEAFEYLLEAKEKGIVRAVGISTHKVAGVHAATRIKEIDVIHPLINRDGIGISDGSAQDMLQAIKDAAAAGKGIYGMKPLGGGHLYKRVPEALAFVLQQDCLHSIALGMYTKEEVDMNVSIFNGEPLTNEIYHKVKQIPKRLHVEDWCQGCARCTEKCPVGALAIRKGKVSVDREKCLLCGYCGAVCPEFCLKII